MAKSIFNIQEVAIQNAVKVIATVLNKEQKNTPFLYNILLTAKSDISKYFKLYLDSNSVPAASVQAWGNNYQDNGRGKGEVILGTVHKTGVNYKLGEEELYDLQNLGSVAATEKAILETIYDDSKNGVFAVQQRMEAILLQTMSSTKTILTADNNPDGLVKTFDYEVPEAQKVPVATVWSDIAAKGLEEIRTWAKYMKETMYVVPKYMFTDSATITNLLNQTATKTEIYANTITTSKSVLSTKTVALVDLNAYLSHYELPMLIEVVDNIKYRKTDGSIDETKRAWGTGKLTFAPEGKLGRLQYMPALKELGSPDYIRTQTGIFNVKQTLNSVTDSYGMKTTVDIAGYPVLDRAHDMFYVNTLHTSVY